MSKVQILSAEVISKIAAGEVVERPASVVKELFENSLDAGARRIEVHLKDGGKTLIHIKDDGSGIAKDDLGILFGRHATSKIRSAQDLESVLSFGFRGEALYSVGAVSEVTLKSRSKASREAWEILVRGGERGETAPSSMAAAGTDIKIHELFFNTPARKKFLKSDASEFDQVLNVIVPYALFYPEVHIVLTHNGRNILDLAPQKTRAQRAAQTLGLNAAHVMESKDEFPNDNIRLTLILGDMNIQRPRRDLQYIFVNGRPVQSRNISFHVNDTYKLILPPSVYPFFAVMLDIPPQEVDVNIHPSKREVRLRQESKVGVLLRQAVERALMTRTSAKEVSADIPKDDIFPLPSGFPIKEEGVPADKIVFAPGQKGFSPLIDRDTVSRESVRPGNFSGFFEKSEKSGQRVADFIPPVQGDKAHTDPVKERFLRARFVGTFIHKYHLFEEGSSLFVVDQHAAQERIMFEKFLRQIHGGKVEVQHLLMPVQIS
ncbi:MAG: DNA mismatch repair endonuclease MutL, partial [Candidatus Omnitrophica bacterium]|nr:DNA mismatch repair endonuclease MutL [Candidatus Omnitrophota bacterium]